MVYEVDGSGRVKAYVETRGKSVQSIQRELRAGRVRARRFRVQDVNGEDYQAC